jgi:hypothetical protein
MDSHCASLLEVVSLSRPSFFTSTQHLYITHALLNYSTLSHANRVLMFKEKITNYKKTNPLLNMSFEWDPEKLCLCMEPREHTASERMAPKQPSADNESPADVPLDKRAEENREPMTKGELESGPEGTIHVGRGWTDRELKKYTKLKEDGEPEEDQGLEREKNAFHTKVHELFERQEARVQARKEKEMGD